MPHLQNSNVDCIEERRFSSGSLTIFRVHYHLLLANWPSLWYTTIFFLPTGHPYGTPSIVYWHTGYFYGTQPSSTDALAVPLVHYCLLLAKCPLCGTHPSSIGPLALPVVHYHLLLAHWPSLCEATIFSGPSPMVHYLFLLAHWLSLWYTTISYLPIGCLYGTLLSSFGPLALHIVHNYLLLAHCPHTSLWYTTISY